MVWQETPFTLPLLATAVIIVVVSIYVLRRQHRYGHVPGGRIAVLFSGLVSLTLVVYVYELESVGINAKLFWKQLGFVGTSALPALLLIYVLYYTEREKFVTRLTGAALAIGPVVTALLAFTNTYHGNFLTEATMDMDRGFSVLVTTPGDWFIVHLAYVYGVLGIAALLLLVQVVRSAGFHRRQALAMFLGAIAPIAGGLAHLDGTLPYADLNLGLVAYIITAGAVLWSVNRHGLFELLPIARQTAVEQMDDAVLVIDVQRRVVDTNLAAASFLRSETDDIVGSSLTTVMEPYAVPSDDEFSGQTSQRTVTVPNTRQYFQRTVSPLTRSDESLIGHLIVLRDITERKQREQRLRQKNERLDQFASVVSHDLRNPLNVISGHVALARETQGDEHFDAIEEAAGRMDQLIDDLLNLARQGENVSELEPIELTEIADAAWRTVNSVQAELIVDSDKVVPADRARLRQAFENLFRNAIEHGAEDVKILVEPIEGGFAVEDDGPGIPDEKHDKIFEHGYTDSESGTGLGLAIVERVVDAHGWDISISNGRKGGARFEITGIETPADALTRSSDGGNEGEASTESESVAVDD